jgi:hypothetical protein
MHAAHAYIQQTYSSLLHANPSHERWVHHHMDTACWTRDGYIVSQQVSACMTLDLQIAKIHPTNLRFSGEDLLADIDAFQCIHRIYVHRNVHGGKKAASRLHIAIS